MIFKVSLENHEVAGSIDAARRDPTKNVVMVRFCDTVGNKNFILFLHRSVKTIPKCFYRNTVTLSMALKKAIK